MEEKNNIDKIYYDIESGLKIIEMKKNEEYERTNIEYELELKKKKIIEENEIMQLNLKLDLEKKKKELNKKYEIDKLNMELDLLHKIDYIKDNNELDKIQNKFLNENRIDKIKKNNEINNLIFELNHEKEKKEIQKKIDINIMEKINIYPYEFYNKSCCTLHICKNQNIIVNFDKIYEIIINNPSLNNYEKNLILLRFSEILTYCAKKYNSVSRFYKLTQIFIIACSIINPALLSININQYNPYYYYIFWTVWILQLLVSLVTGYVSFFKWDKKIFLFNIYKTKINQEIWLFIGLTGKNYMSWNDEYDHSKCVNLFLNRLENLYTQLKLSEFETELKNSNDNNNNNNDANNNIDVKNIMMSRNRI